jgi:hypothetical protein
MFLDGVNKQKDILFKELVEEQAQPWVAYLWERFILLMVVGFVYSILNSLVQNHLKEEEEAQKKKGK